MLDSVKEGPVRKQAYRRAGECELGLRSDPVNCKELSIVQVGPLREQPT